MTTFWAPGRAVRCIFRRLAALGGAEMRLRKDAAAIPGAGPLRVLWQVFALRAIAEFFHQNQDQLISARGQQVLANPNLKAQVDVALEEYRRAGGHGPVVVTFRDAPDA